jgi:hypothetical protein
MDFNELNVDGNIRFTSLSLKAKKGLKPEAAQSWTARSVLPCGYPGKIEMAEL